jgi:transcriptional regulator GlxA family with amidase domain
MSEPLVVAGMSRLLSTAAAGVFASNATGGGYRAGVGTVKPAVVARAIAFVDAHCHEPITVGMIAEAAGVGPRALEYAFRRHQDCTPMQYLQRVRLQRAHRDLQAADPKQGASVAAIAARWGFGNARSFAASYRQIYQKAPSTTLRT